MKLSVLTGTIKRRLLINYRAEADVVQRLLPPPFRPKLQNGFAIVGICLIRLDHERPAGLPAFLGSGGEHAAHRIAVEWTDAKGSLLEGVYIPRRDTDSSIARIAGGRVFPAESHASKFRVIDDGMHVELSMRSLDGEALVEVIGDESQYLPNGSCFNSLDAVSEFFKLGGVGYSPSKDASKLNVIELWTPNWQVRAFAVSKARSSYFDDKLRFPPGTIELDHALVMRNIEHEWRISKDLASNKASPALLGEVI